MVYIGIFPSCAWFTTIFDIPYIFFPNCLYLIFLLIEFIFIWLPHCSFDLAILLCLWNQAWTPMFYWSVDIFFISRNKCNIRFEDHSPAFIITASNMWPRIILKKGLLFDSIYESFSYSLTHFVTNDCTPIVTIFSVSRGLQL